MPSPPAATAQVAVAGVTCGAGSRKGQDSSPQLSGYLGAAKETGADFAGHPQPQTLEKMMLGLP